MTAGGNMTVASTVTPESNPKTEIDVNEAVAFYVELRAKKRDMEAQLAEDLKPIHDGMAQLEAMLLKVMQDLGVKSLPTEHGTAYQRTVRSATIQDRKAFREFVVSNGLYDLADWKANKVQVFDYMKEHKI